MMQYNNIDLTKYNEFIDSCRIKCYEGLGTHKHHIIPKKMGGSNKKENLIILSYVDHYKAHEILASCFPVKSYGYIVNICAMNHLEKWVKNPAECLAQCKERGIQLKNYSSNRKGKIPWNKGLKHSEQTKRKIGDAIKNTFLNGRINIWIGRTHTEESREKMRQANLGKKLSAETIQKRTISRQNNGRPWFTEEQLKRISEVRKRTYKFHRSRVHTIQHVESGLIFQTVIDATIHFNLSAYLIRKMIKQGKFITIKK